MGSIKKKTSSDVSAVQAFVIVAVLGILAGLAAIAFLEIFI